MTHITHTDQIPPRPVRPSDSKRVQDACTAMGKVALVSTVVELLESHSDPCVRRAISILKSTCVEPWSDSLAGGVGDVFVITSPDVYDLVLNSGKLNARGEPAPLWIGSSENADVTVQGMEEYRHTYLTKGAEGWRAALGQQSRGVRTSFTLVSSGTSTVHERGNGYYDGDGIAIAPGDSIHIGSNVIRLHAAPCSEGGES